MVGPLGGTATELALILLEPRRVGRGSTGGPPEDNEDRGDTEAPPLCRRSEWSQSAGAEVGDVVSNDMALPRVASSSAVWGLDILNGDALSIVSSDTVLAGREPREAVGNCMAFRDPAPKLASKAIRTQKYPY